MPTATLIATGPTYTAGEITTALPSCSKSRQRAASKNQTPRASTVGSSREAVRLKYRDAIQSAVDDFSFYDPHLWAGKWAKLTDPQTNEPQYPSQSEADYDLARRLARRFTSEGISGDELLTVVEAAFEQSGLASRSKWQDRPDYRENTLNSACGGLTATPQTHLTVNSGQGGGTTVQIDWSLKSDLRNARAFADRNRGKLLYVHNRDKWLRWQDDRWKWCEKGEEIERGKENAIFLTTEAAKVAAADPDRGAKLVRETAEAHKEPRIMATLKLARSEPGMSVTTAELDADPMLLGVANGVVDLRKGQLLGNRPDMLITRYCTSDFVPGAPAARWLQSLKEVFPGDTDTIDAVQRLAGLTLTGDTREELMIFAVGSGANGKSIFSNILSRILGDNGVAAPSTLLAARRADDGAPRSDLAMLAGARLVSINELPGGMRLDETVAKQLAGREPITARFLHREFFTFQPRFTPWVRTNHRPIIKGTDEGIWRRLCIIRFGRTFSPEEQDPGLEEKLWAEREGILNWMVEGARLYLDSGLTMSAAMKREVAQYRAASDVLGEFLTEETEVDPSGEVQQTALFSGWRLWCERNGYQPGAKATFTERLAERGVGRRKSGSKHFYTGLKMRGST
jgi:putative DNA primase/helicase